MFINPYFKELDLNLINQAGDLSIYSFGVKANIHVQGLPVSLGVKKWDDVHPEHMKANAECVTKLLIAGGKFKGSFHLSAFAFDLSGQNTYGMPINPKVHEGVCGGSSSGSASAVALGLVDFALGTDTGGSIRIPAAYCGVWSIRPTQGSISTNGVIPIGPNTDAVGIIAKNAKILKLAGQTLLGKEKAVVTPKTFLFISDFFQLCPASNRDCLHIAVRKISAFYTVKVISLDELFRDETNPKLKAIHGIQEASKLLLLDTFETIFPWINQNMPNWEEGNVLTPEVRSNLKLAGMTKNEFANDPLLKSKLQNRVRDYKSQLIKKFKEENSVIFMPTVPREAPRINQPLNPQEIFNMITLTSVASLLGLPQVQMPLAEDQMKNPLGLSIMGAPGMDAALLDMAEDLENMFA